MKDGTYTYFINFDGELIDYWFDNPVNIGHTIIYRGNKWKVWEVIHQKIPGHWGRKTVLVVQ